MNQISNLLSHEDCYSLVTLPGGWPGEVKGHIRIIREDINTESFYSLSVKNVKAIQHKILLISNNNYLVSGVRFCLEAIPDIRFRKSSLYDNVNGQVDEYAPDLVILTAQSPNDCGFVIHCLLVLQKINPKIKVVVLTNDGWLTDILSVKWKNFYCINYSDEPSSFIMKIGEILNLDDSVKINPLDVLTSSQLRVLNMIADGLSMSEISKILNVSFKTISLHKKLALARLGMGTKLQQAWMIEAISKCNSLPPSN